MIIWKSRKWFIRRFNSGSAKGIKCYQNLPVNQLLDENDNECLKLKNQRLIECRSMLCSCTQANQGYWGSWEHRHFNWTRFLDFTARSDNEKVQRSMSAAFVDRWSKSNSRFFGPFQCIYEIFLRRLLKLKCFNYFHVWEIGYNSRYHIHIIHRKIHDCMSCELTLHYLISTRHYHNTW